MVRNWVTCFLNNTKALSCLLRNARALVATESEVRANVVPCLAIVGANDHMKVFAEQMAGAMPNVELLVIPGCDHLTTPRAERRCRVVGISGSAHAVRRVASDGWLSDARSLDHPIPRDQFPGVCFMNLRAEATVGSFARATLSISEMWLSRGT